MHYYPYLYFLYNNSFFFFTHESTLSTKDLIKARLYCVDRFSIFIKNVNQMKIPCSITLGLFEIS